MASPALALPSPCAMKLGITSKVFLAVLLVALAVLLAMGVACGYLGALPSLLWAFSAAALIFAPLLVVVSVWLYTLVFVFSSCWFAHFALAELQRLRGLAAPQAGRPSSPSAPIALIQEASP